MWLSASRADNELTYAALNIPPAVGPLWRKALIMVIVTTQDNLGSVAV